MGGDGGQQYFSSLSITTAGRMAGAVCDPADRGGAVDLHLPAKRSDEWHAPRNDGDAGRYAITSDVHDAYRCLDAGTRAQRAARSC